MKLFSKLWDFLINNLDRILVGLLIFLVIISIGVMGSDYVKNCVSGLIGLTAKNKILTFLGIGMGGILFILQVLASHRRAKAMEDAANEQANSAKAQARATEEQARANENTEQGQRQERLKNAIEHLGHDSSSVRLGGAYELFHLAEDNKDLRKTAFDILCAHIRQTTGEKEYQEKHGSKPSEEIQSLLTLLFVQDHEVFKGLHINLQGSWLNGANLREARLQGAILSGAHLQGATLAEAQLQEADLTKAHLEAYPQVTNLSKACLQGATLTEARLQGSNLKQARLQGACLMGGFLQKATLDGAYLQGADLSYVRLQVAHLSGVQLQGARLSFLYLLGATLSGAKLQGAGEQSWTSSTSFACRIRKSINKESDLSSLVSGGIGQGVVDSLCEGLSEDKKMEIREILRHYIEQPVSYGLPESSGAITGTYSEEEAEKWIAEYEEAMSEMSEDDN